MSTILYYMPNACSMRQRAFANVGIVTVCKCPLLTRVRRGLLAVKVGETCNSYL